MPETYYVTIPADPAEPISMTEANPATLFAEIKNGIGYGDAPTSGLVDRICPDDADGLCIWIDDEGALFEGWRANPRATWLCVTRDHPAIVAGNVVVTRGETDESEETQGLDYATAARILFEAQSAPPCDVAGLTAQLQAQVDAGPVVMSLTEDEFENWLSR